MEERLAVVATARLGSRTREWDRSVVGFTKTIIAAAVVLVQQARLSLDQPLANRRYTLRQLLQHRAGLAEYGDLAAYHAASPPETSHGRPPFC